MASVIDVIRAELPRYVLFAATTAVFTYFHKRREQQQEHPILQLRKAGLERTLCMHETAFKKLVQRIAELERKLWMQESVLELRKAVLQQKRRIQELAREKRLRQTEELKRTTDAKSCSEVMSKRALASA